MTKTLGERLQHAQTVVDEVTAVLGRQGSAIPVLLAEQFQRSLEIASGIDHWRELIAARRAALVFLDGLEKRVDGDDNVPIFVTTEGPPPVRLKFSHARLLGVEAYLSLAWSLADRITAMVGRVLCTIQGGAFHDQSPVKLVSHFIQEEVGKSASAGDDGKRERDAKSRKRSTAAMVSDSIRLTFGYPVAVSYAIRNHFVHDGAQQKEVEFFESRASSGGFRISNKGWSNVEGKALGYGVGRDYIRKATAWPASPQDDLRLLLAVCETELDEALGVLVHSACQALAFHIAAMVGAD